MALAYRGHIAQQHGSAVALGHHDVVHIVSECSRPMPRTFTLWLPRVR